MPAELSQESTEVLDRIPSFSEGESAPPSTAPQPSESAPQGGESSSEPGTPKTALEAAERVMERAREASLTSAQQPQPGAPQDALKAQQQAESLKPDDAKLPFKDHPRWKEVTSEVRILRVAKEKNETAIKEMEPKAQTFDQLSGWLREQNLGRDDLSQLLSIGAAVRNDPMKAYELLRPIMEDLESMVGVRLPPDLQRAVEQGSMTSEAAQAIARSRGEATLYKGRAETLEARREQERAAREQQELERHIDSLAQAADTHVKSWAARDPDAAYKRPFVEELVELEFRKRDAEGNPPKTAEEATQVVDMVIQAVNERFRRTIPRPRPATSGILPGGAHSVTETAPVPKSSLEAAQLALSRGGG